MLLTGVAVVEDAPVPGSIAEAQGRHPTLDLDTVQRSSQISAAIDMENLRTEEELAEMHASGKYFMGEAVRRDAATARPTAVTTDAAGLPVDNSTATQLTAESGLFPGLFPTGKGWNTGCMRQMDYIKQRNQQLFSPW
jgi:hypothetical protein